LVVRNTRRKNIIGGFDRIERKGQIYASNMWCLTWDFNLIRRKGKRMGKWLKKN